MASTYIIRTPSSAGNRKTFTISVWVKRTTLDSDYILVAKTGTGASDSFSFGFRANQIQITSQSAGGTSNINVRSNALYRDTFGWYNLVLAVDTTQSTASDRVKLYVNGSQVTSLENTTYPSQNDDIYGINNTIEHAFGRENYEGGVDYHEYLLSHIHFIDGTAYQASDFGQYDANGVWTIKTSPSVTYGTNGFFILKDGNSVTDQSGNGNNFTVGGGTLTNTEDNPSNVFATMNPLDNYYAGSTFSKGNNTVVTGSSSTTYNTSTIAIEPTMKCYWEAKFDTTQSGNGEIGIVDKPTTSSSAGGGASRLYYQTYGISVNDLGQVWGANANTGITLGTLSTSDIICFAWDGVNSALYVRKNGDAWINSGDPTSGASKTGAVKTHSGTRIMFPAVGDQNGSGTMQSSLNFGNGYFGTTAVSSAGSNASNNGIFEYDVPSGFTALSTKGLNL